MNTYLEFAEMNEKKSLYSGEYKIFFNDGTTQEIKECSRYRILNYNHHFRCLDLSWMIPNKLIKRVERIK